MSNPILKVFGEKNYSSEYTAAQMEEQKGVNIYELPSFGDSEYGFKTFAKNQTYGSSNG